MNSLLNRLKGHHASLVGCQAVEGTPELITADSSGVVKVRPFNSLRSRKNQEIYLDECAFREVMSRGLSLRLIPAHAVAF